VSTLVALFHHRWGAPVLAELHRSAGGRFVVVAHRLGLGRESLRRTLKALLDAGLVMRNPGYGHPLRPEYVLTERGSRIGAHCAELVERLRELDAEGVGLKKWSMPVLYALGGTTGLRFSELRALLPGITPRALALALKDLEAAGLLERRVLDEYPPATLYRLAPRAKRLVRAVSALAG
jgi:DNA-binding HxlR family transcriptional regulator